VEIVNSPTAGRRVLRKLSLAAACVGLLTVSGPAVASASLTPALSKPTVVSFKAAPSHLSAAGGFVTLTAKVSGASTCIFGGHGTPVTVSCTGGTAKVKDKLGGNKSAKKRTIVLSLVVKGKGGTAPKAVVKVTEAAKVSTSTTTPTTAPAPTTTTSANSSTACVGPCTFTFPAPDYNDFTKVEFNGITQGVQCPNAQTGGCAATSAQQIDQVSITMCAGGSGVQGVSKALTDFTLEAASGATASLDPVSSSPDVSTAFGNFSTLAAGLCDTGNLYFDLTANTQWDSLTFNYTSDSFTIKQAYTWSA
jgi:hypothetical protein